MVLSFHSIWIIQVAVDHVAWKINSRITFQLIFTNATRIESIVYLDCVELYNKYKERIFLCIYTEQHRKHINANILDRGFK